MKFDPVLPPRTFNVGKDGSIRLAQTATVSLAPDELVTFTDDLGGEYDVVRKDWGYYATPSLNGRLLRNGYKTALVRNDSGQYFVMLVINSRMQAFESYLRRENQHRVLWLDEVSESSFK